MAKPNPLELLSTSARQRLERYAKLHGEKPEVAAVRAIENWLEDVGEIQMRIKEAQRAHDAALRGDPPGS